MFADDKKPRAKFGSLGKNPSLNTNDLTGLASRAGDAIGGTAGERIAQAKKLAQQASQAKNSLMKGAATASSLVSGGSGATARAAASSAMGGADPSGLLFTLTSTSLPAQTFVVVDFTLTEAFSSPFALEVNLASADPAVDFAAVLDDDATLFIWRDGELQRSITGMVARFEQGDTGLHQTRYSMTLRPALWRTGLRRNSRIFQQVNIESIITTLLKENGIHDFAFGFRHAHPVREFCVQYQESDGDFLQRLTAEEGIFYYFEFGDGKNIVVYTDDVGTQPTEGSLPYNTNSAEQAPTLCITTFTRSEQVRPAKVGLKDYTFKDPKWPAEFSKQANDLQHQREHYEHFDFPGRFKDVQHGEDFTRYRLEALRNDAHLGQGQSNDFTLQPGVLFRLTDHPRADLNQRWQILNIQHNGQQPQALEQASGGQGTVLTNRFTFLPPTQTWRPSPLPKPVMDGPQIATVVGPPSEEIFCDEFGRVRLQFLWDRYGKSNDHSSCWIRVTQPWAGQGWGMLAIPRIGQEVVVDFLHGDPDQPIVTGRTYHANNLPPGSLPASKTQMAFRSKTHKGTGYNELRFEDNKGGEGLFMHAQRDMTTKVLNDRTTTVLANHTETVTKNQAITVLQNHDLTAHSNHSVAIQGDQTTVVGGKREEMVQGPLVLSSASGIRLVCGDAVIELDGKGNISFICKNFNFYGSANGQLTTGGVLDMNMDGGGPGTQAGPAASAIKAAVKAAFPPAQKG